MTTLLRNICAFGLLVTLAVGCGGGGDGEGGSAQVEPCDVLRIAGGDSCDAAPRSIAIVATNSGYCTGTFITRQHVLTAAHCFSSPRERVVVGTTGYAEDAARVVIHPSYNGDVSSPFDVAVVTIPAPINVSPVGIKLSQDISKGDEVVIYGFGLDQNGQDVVTRVREGGIALKATNLRVVGVDEGTVLSQSDGSGDTCQGDSGGALLLTGTNGQPGVVALVRAGPPGCVLDPGRPSQNTNVQSSGVLNFVLAQAPGAGTN
jgi:hypothetical protein